MGRAIHPLGPDSKLLKDLLTLMFLNKINYYCVFQSMLQNIVSESFFVVVSLFYNDIKFHIG